MKTNRISNSLFTLMLFIAAGCGNQSTTVPETEAESGDMVEISIAQFEGDSMKTGEISIQKFEDEVICNGNITAPANGIAQISTPISGIVESISCVMGEYVQKGQPLCMISSNELMVIQQEYTETAARLKQLKTEYERSKSLFDEKIGAEKDFIATESEYKVMLSKYQSLKLRLQLFKLNISKIEAGELYSLFPVISPINGYITSQNMVLGQFIEQQKSLVEIVDVNQLQLQLSVFEKETGKLKIGQNILFKTMGEATAEHSAMLTSISKTIDPVSKTILCLAKITDKKGVNLVNRSYIEARITVNQKEANALPSEAILKSGKEYFVYVVEKSDKQVYVLRKQKVEIGKTSNGFTEIIGNPDFTKVLIKGVYNLPV